MADGPPNLLDDFDRMASNAMGMVRRFWSVEDPRPSTPAARAPAAPAPAARAPADPAADTRVTPTPGQTPPSRRDWPRGPSFTEHRIGLADAGSANGSGEAMARRAYHLFTPGGLLNGPRPLIVMLHGCRQTPMDFALGTRMNALATAKGCYVVYPQQTEAANTQMCWNWYQPGDQRRGSGEPAIIAAIVDHLIAEGLVDASRIYAAGLSAGGAAAAILGVTYADRFAAIGVHSGLPCGAAQDLGSAFSAMRAGIDTNASLPHAPVPIPTIVFHGDADSTVHPRNADAVLAQAMKPFGPLTLSREGGQAAGRAFTRRVGRSESGAPVLEQWLVHGAGHAWSGGDPDGSFADAEGPDAAGEMLRFFLTHRRA